MIQVIKKEKLTGEQDSRLGDASAGPQNPPNRKDKNKE